MTISAGMVINIRNLLAAVVLLLAGSQAGLAGPPLTAKWLGVSTILLDDGETAIMTDGFFSRPGFFGVLFTRIAPKQRRIDDALRKAGVSRLAAIMVAHSHHDHAMDAPVVAKKTGAVIIGSESTANIARGLDFPEDRIRVVEGGEQFTFGRFHIKIIRGRHSPGELFPGKISEPLRPPTRIWKYRPDLSFAFVIDHDSQTIVIVPSANFVPGFLQGVRADVIFLSMAVLGKQDQDFIDQYWRETVGTIGAKRIIPIHWDNFFKSLDEPVTPLPWPADDFDAGVKAIQERAAVEHAIVDLPAAFATIDLSRSR